MEGESEGVDLSRLPLPALSVVLFWLDVPTAFELARHSARLFAAFKDELAWRRRCLLLLGPNELPENNVSWREHFRLNRCWKVRVMDTGHYAMHHYFYGREDHSFTVRCTPRTTVAEFLRLAVVHEHNTCARKSVLYEPRFEPFDNRESTTAYVEDWSCEMSEEPTEVVDTGKYGVERWPVSGRPLRRRKLLLAQLPPKPGPNCTFDDSDFNATIKAAGLCRDAELEHIADL